MNRCILILILAILPAHSPSSEKAHSQLYYLQLIRGTVSPAPGEASWKPIGRKLTHRLSPIFRWDHYWEVNRVAVEVEDHQPRKIRLSPEREVEIHRNPPKTTRVRVYRNAELVRESRQALATSMFIVGGDRAAGEAWFVIVRDDKPQ